MNGRQRGFLLLTSHLGDPQRHPLSPAQFRTLAQRVRSMERPAEQRDLRSEDLLALGYGREMAERILTLLDEEDVLDYYLNKGKQLGCQPLTWACEQYPQVIRKKLGEDAPACLWAKGDLQLLDKPMISLVGSRELLRENYRFACEMGRQAAKQGFVLVSGNARGADRTAQRACLEAGGQVISVVADELSNCMAQERMLYLSEDTFDGAFSALRALSRNRIIHCLGGGVFVAQCNHGKGGTWDGSVKNLRQGWSSIFCYRDGSAGVQALLDMGAEPVELVSLQNIHSLIQPVFGLFDQ